MVGQAGHPYFDAVSRPNLSVAQSIAPAVEILSSKLDAAQVEPPRAGPTQRNHPHEQ